MVSQKGIAHLALIVLTVIGIGIGLYLVQTKTDLFPSAQIATSPARETAFHLNVEKNYYVSQGRDPETIATQSGRDQNISYPGKSEFYPGDKIVVNVRVSSDVDAANTFSAIVNFPTDLLEVIGIQKENWGGGSIMHSDSPEDLVPDKQQGRAITIPPTVPSEGRVCVQVITRACYQKDNCTDTYCTGAYFPRECKDFPTPCDVPEGWYIEGEGQNCTETGICSPGLECKPICPANPNGATCDAYGSFCRKPTPVSSPINCSLVADCAVPPAGCKSVPDAGGCCGKIVCENPNTTWINDYFIQHWLPETTFDNQTGKVVLTGGVVGAGIKTATSNRPILATITFAAKKVGEAKLEFGSDSLILRNSDSTNILSRKDGINIQIQERARPVTRGDLDGDGFVGVIDFSILLSNWGSDSPKADINGDGKVNIYDFSIMLSNWTNKEVSIR